MVGEHEDIKFNNDKSEKEYLAVDENNDKEEPYTALKNVSSSPKPQLSNFSVLSLLARKSPDREKEKQSLADNSSQKEIHFPSNGEDVTEDIDQAKQSSQVIK